MCGILINISKNPNFTFFESILKEINHRGPDDSGIYKGDNIILGHTRLSIIDTSNAGHQPMESSCGRYVIVYNGEIYNFNEIKENLIKLGYSFSSNSDTEVLLIGFIEYGENILKKLNGMFAFSIYDNETDITFIARDRSGIKPLYYMKNEDEILLSSEVKVFKKISSKINKDAEVLFLLLGYVPDSTCIYDGVKSFPAGHYAYCENQQIKLTNFDSYIFEPKIQKEYNEIVSDVRHLLEDSVKRHLISDAPIGTFLSGGLDSSVITALAAKNVKQLRTLSLIFNEKGYSEEYYQDLIVKKYKTNHTKYLITQDIFKENIHNFISSMDQPSIDGINTFFVSKAAKDIGLKTVLSGLGGDEIFYGYSTFKNSRKLNVLSKLPKSFISLLGRASKYEKHSDLLKIENELNLYLPTRGIFSISEISSYLGVSKIYIYKLISKVWEENRTDHLNYIDDKISKLELSLYMKNQLLRDSDVFSMANSLEIRVPLLDRELVNYVLRINPKMKFDKKVNKIVLADAARNLLPEEVISRKKMGFTLPFANWFSNSIDDFDINPLYHGKEIPWFKKWSLLVLDKYNN